MCERQDGALDIYYDARKSLEKKLSNNEITNSLYNNIKNKLVLIREHIEDSDYNTFTQDIYNTLNMQECDKCLLPPSRDCEICNGTCADEIFINFESLEEDNMCKKCDNIISGDCELC